MYISFSLFSLIPVFLTTPCKLCYQYKQFQISPVCWLVLMSSIIVDLTTAIVPFQQCETKQNQRYFFLIQHTEWKIMDSVTKIDLLKNKCTQIKHILFPACHILFLCWCSIGIETCLQSEDIVYRCCIMLLTRAVLFI